MTAKHKTATVVICVGLLHLAAIFAGFLAPYDFAQQNRSLPYAPPSLLHFRDVQGAFHLRPSVCAQRVQPETFANYYEDRQNCFPLHFLVRGSDYKLLGVFSSNLHLFGVGEPATVFLLGTDGYGRDVLSRLLYGSQISLFSGLLATVLSLGLGGVLGIMAGYYGGWLDGVIMRCAELFLSLPWLYLLFAVRAFLPLHVPPAQSFLLIVATIGVVGWARPARLVRGTVLSAKERHYVMAARMFGGSDLYLMRRHILPQTYNLLLTQAALLVPQYVLAEVMLSFLGLGVSEPVPSWGSMLSTLQQYDVLVSYWWMWSPGFALVFASFTYLAVANVMQNADCLT